MKKFIASLLLVTFIANTFAQIGINTTDPNATLDIVASNQVTPANTDGILIPRVDNFPLIDPTINQDGMMVYITGDGTPSKGFYFWNNNILDWVSIVGSEKINDLLDGKSDDDGTDNGSSVFLGTDAGLNDDATDNKNVGVGFEALKNNTSGNNNVAIGSYALIDNTTGENNTATGTDALRANTTGSHNSAFGGSALFTSTTGDYNVALGYNASFGNITGSYNTSIGSRSLMQNNHGVKNVAVGASSISDNNASYNTAIGYDSFNTVLDSNFSNSTAIGYNTAINDSNQLHFGNASVTEIKGQVAFSTYSDGRIKDNVRENVIGLDFITKLRPVTYNFNVDRQNSIMDIKDESDYKNKYAIEKIEYSGFIAQEVEKAAKEVNYNFSGIKAPNKENELYGLSYSEFVVPLVKAVQEQQEMIDEIKNSINTKEKLIKMLNKRIETIEIKIQKN